MFEICFKWWQAIIYEIAVVSLGIALGIFFYDFLKSLLLPFVAVFLILGTYIIIALIKQIKYE
jgi:hypothetical protein